MTPPKYGMRMCTLSQRIAVGRLGVGRWLLYVSCTKFTGLRSCIIYNSTSAQNCAFRLSPSSCAPLYGWMTSFCIGCSVRSLKYTMMQCLWCNEFANSQSSLKYSSILKLWSDWQELQTPKHPTPACVCTQNYHKQFLSTCDLLKWTHWLPMWLLTELPVSTHEPPEGISPLSDVTS